jgi:FKBP-type peptidyl-prolyl cis-trans isomerase
VIIEIELLNTLTENENIDKYIATKYPQLSFTKTSTDLRFAVTSANPTGESLTAGKKVSLKYTGKLLFEMRKVDANNKLYYDAQFDANTMDFTVGANLTVRGFEEGVARMKVGEKAVFIFPSNIGYSSSGSVNQTTGVYVIPPYSSLQFEVEVVSVK